MTIDRDDDNTIPLAKVNPFEGFHVDLVEDTLEGGEPGLSIYIYKYWSGQSHDAEPLITVSAQDQWEAGNVKRAYMLMQWLCRYINSGGSLNLAYELLGKVQDYVGVLPPNPKLHFLGYKLSVPENGYIPSDRDEDPYSPFVYYVCTEGYDLDNILEVHENQHAHWVNWQDTEL